MGTSSRERLGSCPFVTSEQGFHFVEPALLVRHYVGLLQRGQLTEDCFVFGIQLFRDDELDFEVEIPGPSAARIGHPFSSETYDFTGLCSRGQFDIGFSLQKGDFYFGAQRRLRVADRNLADQVDTFTLEDRVGTHMNVDVQVTTWSAVRSRLALAA